MKERLLSILIILCSWALSHTILQAQSLYISSQATEQERGDFFYQAALQEQSPSEAQSYFQQALDHYLLCDVNPGLLLRMAYCASRLSQAENQVKYLNESLSEGRRLFGASDPRYIQLVLSAAAQAIEAGDDTQAYRWLKVIKSDCRRVPAMEVQWLSCMSDIELHAGRFRRAHSLRKKAVRISTAEYRKNASEENRERYVNALKSMAGATIPLWAPIYYNKAYDEYVATVYSEFNKKSEASRVRYWGSVSSFFDDILSQAEWMPGKAYDAVLLTKGLLLNTSIAFQEFVKNSGDSVAIRYQAERNQLIALGARAELVDSLDILIIQRLNTGTFPFKDGSVIHWKDVRNCLDKDDLAIEFYNLPGERYGALLLKKGWRQPIHRNLSGPYEVWSKAILRYFPQNGKGRVFFSPAGQMNLNAVEYQSCKIPGLEEYCMADVFQMYRLSSTRELVEWKRKPEGNIARAGVYGGVRYDADEADLTEARAGLSLHNRLTDEAFEQRLLRRDRNDRIFADNPPALPETALETRAIDSLLTRHRTTVELFTGKFATEEALNAYSGEQNILHFATHGFYVSAQDIKDGKSAYYSLLFSARPDLLLDPLYRSGLHMAGASSSWAGIPFSENLSDGILTAREISMLDLSKVDMVVLSACDSGVGDLSADGVYGLPRAFKKAGAGTILMSLNPVYDDSTRYLMYCFYQNLLLGKEKRTAFMDALSVMRKIPKWSNPQIWQSFILMDALP